MLIILSLIMNYYTLIIIDFFKGNVRCSFYCCLLGMNWAISALQIYIWKDKYLWMEQLLYKPLCSEYLSKANIN